MVNKYGKHSYSKYDGRRIYEHVAAWEDFMETPVPFDDNGNRCVIHHIDEDETNNEITNLACMTKSDHTAWHGSHLSKEKMERLIKSRTGKKRSEETRKNISNSVKGKKKSKEHIQKIIETKKLKRLNKLLESSKIN